MRILESMKNENAYEEWQTIKYSWQKKVEKFNDKSIDNYNKKYYTNNVKKERNQEMKMMKDKNGKVVMYNVRNEELNRNLRKLGHKVVPNKKKQAQKNACRKGW